MRKGRLLIMGLVLVALLLVQATGAAETTDPQKPGKRIQIPIIEKEGGWKTWGQVQNAGDEDTGVIVFFWGEYSGLCPSNNPGPNYHACWHLPENGVWTLRGAIPQDAKSALIYSVAYTQYATACDEAKEVVGAPSKWSSWEGRYGGTGEDLVVAVHRQGPNDFGTPVAGMYMGISENMEGEGPVYEYFAPYVMKNYNGLDTVMSIQNSGQECVQFSIYYREQTSSSFCQPKFVQLVETLAPGEAIRLRVPEVKQLGGIKGSYLGSAYISSSQPLGIIIDTTSFDDPELPSGPYDKDRNRGMLFSHRGTTYPSAVPDTELYADLLFREWSGWSSSIQVQNMGKTSQPTFVAVDFVDSSGDTVYYLADWVCHGGAQTFYLPAIYDLGFNYLGAAEIHSLKQIGFPGEIPGQPIAAVVEVKSQGTGQGGTYIPHARHQKEGVRKIAFPFVALQNASGVTSLVAIRNNSNCGKIMVEAELKQGNGRVVCKLHNWIDRKHIWSFDLANIGCIVPGWEGALRVDVIAVEKLCDNEALVMPSVVVVNRGTGPGDTTTVAEGFPAPGMPPKVPEPTPTPTPTPTSTATPTPTPCVDP